MTDIETESERERGEAARERGRERGERRERERGRKRGAAKPIISGTRALGGREIVRLPPPGHEAASRARMKS